MERPRIEQMISVLQQTERQYLELLPILQKEKQMIISARLDDIQKVSEEKERLLQSIRQLESRRKVLLDQLASDLEMKSEGLTLSAIAERVSPSYRTQLIRLRTSLKTIMAKVAAVNNESRALIHHCLGTIRQALSFLTPKSTDSSVYQSSGALSQHAGEGRLLSSSV